MSSLCPKLVEALTKAAENRGAFSMCGGNGSSRSGSSPQEDLSNNVAPGASKVC